MAKCAVLEAYFGLYGFQQVRSNRETDVVLMMSRERQYYCVQVERERLARVSSDKVDQ